MKARRILLLVALLTIAVVGIYAQSFGIGGVFGIAPIGGLPSNAMLTFTTKQIPFVVALGFELGQNQFNMGLMLDWWLYHQHLAGMLDLYAGPGLFLALPSNLVFGGRVPVGLRLWPLGTSFLELFLEIAPGITLINPRGIKVPDFTLQAGFGFRFWFK
jgi:hypothetical protein